ncbi:hypothetical protein M3205_15110 [Cytobacillus firmus]|nr:hypothetical protein [Cytobacillus firmus]MCM3707047.1 hypothetical protein [Cytobacillus firmus]
MTTPADGLDHHFPHSTGWTIVFYGVLVAIALLGWFAPGKKQTEGEAL